MSTPPLYQHQLDDIQFILERPHTFNTSDAGTGKTRTIIEVIRRDPERRPALVLAPKSILQASWGNDIMKFAPELDYVIAHPSNRMNAIKASGDIVLTNHDAVTGIAAKNKRAFDAFKYVVIDESTAYKNGEAQRSKAVRELIQRVPYRTAMTGTPAPNGVLDLWHQLLLVDGGTRLGHRFYAYRNACCTPTEKRVNGVTFKTWADKPGIQTVIGQQIADITIRRTLEECLNIPKQQLINYRYEPNKKVRALYNTMANDAVLEISEGRFAVGIHAASQSLKALQILSGAVYDTEKEYALLDTERYDLVLDLIEQRSHSLVGFIWRHQRHYLQEQAKKRGISFATIDGGTSFADRTQIVEEFQSGKYQVLFAHPQSTGHGLTLTRATTVIWSSPTYNLEHYLQFNRRIYRAGQNKKTEIITIEAENTIEQRVYATLNQKREVQHDLLGYLDAAA